MPPFYGVWLWLKANPVAQGIAFASAALGVFWIWITVRDRRRRGEMIREIELKAERTSRKVIDTAKENANETVRQADEARASIPAGTPSGELPKRIQDAIFHD